MSSCHNTSNSKRAAATTDSAPNENENEDEEGFLEALLSNISEQESQSRPKERKAQPLRTYKKGGIEKETLLELLFDIEENGGFEPQVSYDNKGQPFHRPRFSLEQICNAKTDLYGDPA